VDLQPARYWGAHGGQHGVFCVQAREGTRRLVDGSAVAVGDLAPRPARAEPAASEMAIFKRANRLRTASAGSTMARAPRLACMIVK
jgi:hypothetical protein